jgi:hypothetical protein
MGTRRSRKRGKRSLVGVVREHRNTAMAIVTVLLGLALTGDRARDLLSPVPTDELPARAASIVLLAASIAYLLSWVFGSDIELGAVEELGEQHLVVVPRSESRAILGAAAGLGLLALLSINVLAFAVALLSLKAIELWASWDLAATVRLNSEAALGERPELTAAIDVVGAYYLGIPWVQTTAVVLYALAVAIAIAAYSAAMADRPLGAVGTALAAGIVIAVMVVQETVTWRRRLRYRDALHDALPNEAE